MKSSLSTPVSTSILFVPEWYCLRCIVHVLLNTGSSVSVWDFVKFSNHTSRTLNDIEIIKVWFVPWSAGYRQLSHEFDPRNDNIEKSELQFKKTGNMLLIISLVKFYGAITEIQHSIAIGFIFPTQYAIKFMKLSTIDILDAQCIKRRSWCVEIVWSWLLRYLRRDRKLLLNQSKIYRSIYYWIFFLTLER